MIRSALLAGALASLGCSASYVPVTLEDDTPENRQLVEDGVRMAFELPVEFVDDDRGAVFVEIFVANADTDSKLGELIEKSRCYRSIRAHRHEIVVAHEIGHALGLRHSLTGLMHAGNVTSWGVSDIQMDTVVASLDRLDGC